MSHSLQLIRHQHEDEKYRQGFNQLARDIFGCDFERWYQLGWWDDNYCCYSYVDMTTAAVVASTGVCKVHFLIEGQELVAVQLHATMTRPAYRKQGLSRDLTRTVLQDYRDQADVVYALANRFSQPVFRQLGFQIQKECEFFLSIPDKKKTRAVTRKRKLDVTSRNDRQTLLTFITERKPLSQTFHVANAQSLFFFNCLNTFKNDLYFLPDDDVIVSYKQEGRTLHIHDILCRKEFSLQKMLDGILHEGTRAIIFDCTPPDWSDLSIQCRPLEGEEQFLLNPALDIAGKIRYPALA